MLRQFFRSFLIALLFSIICIVIYIFFVKSGFIFKKSTYKHLFFIMIITSGAICFFKVNVNKGNNTNNSVLLAIITALLIFYMVGFFIVNAYGV